MADHGCDRVLLRLEQPGRHTHPPMKSRPPFPLQIPRRYGMVLRVKPERFEDYKRHHAAVWPGVLERITASQIRNYSIFHREGWLFSYFEYWETISKPTCGSSRPTSRRDGGGPSWSPCRTRFQPGRLMNGGRGWRKCFTTTDHGVCFHGLPRPFLGLFASQLPVARRRAFDIRAPRAA